METSKLIYDREGNSKGCGIVTFTSSAYAQAAMQNYEYNYVDDKWVDVKECIQKVKPVARVKAEGDQERHAVWIGGIPTYLSQPALFRNFKHYGDIRMTHLAVDGSGFSRGFGFIEFWDKLAQQNCLNDVLNHVIDGEHWITVNPARPDKLPPFKAYTAK